MYKSFHRSCCLTAWMIAFLFSGCSSGYQEKNGRYYLNGKEVSNKDLHVLSNEFARDSFHVYYRGETINDADVKSFTALDEHYAIDKHHVYHCHSFRESQD